MIWQGFQILATPIPIEGAGWIQRIIWSFQGVIKYFEGNTLPYGQGDWYWIPSRAIPGEPITEFPAFTFLYADPHAHLFALGITILALIWALSVILAKWRWKYLQLPASLVFGGIIIGALRPTNTWDLPVYLGLGIIALGYTAFRYNMGTGFHQSLVSQNLQKIIIPLVAVIVLGCLTFFLYQPFSNWYGQAYTSASFWDGDHTPIWSYLTHWGLFLFVITSWLTWETIDWMATTPVSSLNKLRPYKLLIQLGLAISLAIIAGLLYLGVQISVIAIPLMIWAFIIIFRPGQQDSKRAILFITSVGVSLTLVVELVVLKGDIGRMNTVFKFYLQAWTLLSLSAAAGIVYIIPVFTEKWKNSWHYVWQVILFLLIGGAMLFPLLGGADKINDRISRSAPHTLDGMAYMPFSTYNEDGTDLDLSHDYRAILWMLDHVQGSPVIVETNTPEYRWGSRFTIYTGLPGVVGWNWHQRQQRAIIESDIVTGRIADITDFYTSNSQADIIAFLSKYDVQYIIVGQLEKTIYPGLSLDKFTSWNGKYWDKVYEDGDTAIYKVKKINS
jgi:YYY domain-containing protein